MLRLSPEVPTASTARRMSRQRTRNTAVETALRQALHARGLRYRLHRRPIEGLRREADIVFVAAKVVIMVDGCFWHGCPIHGTWPKSNAEWWRTKIEKNRTRDRETDERFAAEGWMVLRVWEHEAAAEAADRISPVIRARRTA